MPEKLPRTDGGSCSISRASLSGFASGVMDRKVSLNWNRLAAMEGGQTEGPREGCVCTEGRSRTWGETLSLGLSHEVRYQLSRLRWRRLSSAEQKGKNTNTKRQPQISRQKRIQKDKRGRKGKNNAHGGGRPAFRKKYKRGRKSKNIAHGGGRPAILKKAEKGEKQTAKAAGTGCTTSGTPATATRKIKN